MSEADTNYENLLRQALMLFGIVFINDYAMI